MYIHVHVHVYIQQARDGESRVFRPLYMHDDVEAKANLTYANSEPSSNDERETSEEARDTSLKDPHKKVTLQQRMDLEELAGRSKAVEQLA